VILKQGCLEKLAFKLGLMKQFQIFSNGMEVI